MKIKLFIFAILIALSSINAQNLKSPSEFLGYEIGTRFTPQHKVVEYFKHVSDHSNNVLLEEYGKTNEYRPLILSYISSENNINNLEKIRKNNLDQLSGKGTNDKAIVWLSYNVHGNEASATEAAILTLYELISTKKAWLENTVVIIDPCLNPDGRDRYVNWYNQVGNAPYNINPEAKEHNEPWPGGRPNHYLFDLNRDWAWATQVETQQRLKVYNKWMPHVHVDFHEQGINSPYYFAPAAEPFHEIITDWQRNFQTEVGKNNAKYFDKEGWLYFTKESFDLLYPSYGDTYPTFMGAIGMTYEQAGHGRAGLGIQTDHGYVLTLKDRAQHHLVSGLSSVEISSQNAAKLNDEFRKYFDNSGLVYKSYVLKNDNQDKINRLIALLDQHEIEYENAENGTAKGLLYSSQKEGKLNLSTNDLVIHTNQPKGKMVNVLFEPKTQLSDSLTYDITAWSLPYAYGLEALASKTQIKSKEYTSIAKKENSMKSEAYAYIAKWNSIEDAGFLADILKHDILPRYAEEAFSVEGNSFDRGSLIILRNDNSNKNFDDKIVAIANAHDRKLTSVSTGFSDSGKDFGSYSVRPIHKQKVAVLTGEGTSSLSFGEIWHFFEVELEYPVTIIDTDYISRVNMSNYDVLVIPEGYYGSALNKSNLDKLVSFTRSGGTVIAIGSALNSFAGKKGFSLKRKKSEEVKDKGPNLTPYASSERSSAVNLIAGAIFKSTIDDTHPLAFGYGKNYFTLKRSSSAFDFLPSGNVAYFLDKTNNVGGFAGEKVLERLPNTLLFGEERKGRGSFIYFADNPLFRAFWDNGKLFFANAVFLRNSSIIKK